MSLWTPSAGLALISDDEWVARARAEGISEEVIERSRERDQRARLVLCERALLLTLRTWSGSTSTSDDLEDVTEEWDVFLGPDFVLMRSDGGLPSLPLAEIRSSTQFLCALLDASVDQCYPAMDQMDGEIDALELAVYSVAATQALSSPTLELAPALHLKKQLLMLRQTVSPLRDLVNQLLRLQHMALDSQTPHSLQDIFDRALRLTEQIDLHREILSGVLEATMAQTSNRLNQQMKRLTALAAMALPVTAITGFFGMNIGHFERAPSWSLWAAVLTMALGSGTALLYFQRRGYW